MREKVFQRMDLRIAGRIEVARRTATASDDRQSIGKPVFDQLRGISNTFRSSGKRSRCSVSS